MFAAMTLRHRFSAEQERTCPGRFAHGCRWQAKKVGGQCVYRCNASMRVVRPVRRLREDSLAPGLLVTGAALLVATFGPEKAHRVPETRLPPECTDSALAICACELLPETRVADITFQWNEVADCNLHAAHQPGVSYVSDIERICRTAVWWRRRLGRSVRKWTILVHLKCPAPPKKWADSEPDRLHRGSLLNERCDKPIGL